MIFEALIGYFLINGKQLKIETADLAPMCAVIKMTDKGGISGYTIDKQHYFWFFSNRTERLETLKNMGCPGNLKTKPQGKDANAP